ncbi:DUF309 domain-containing protein [Cytobacillus depressus]|uniref:DUF309 domain-containing protein n=1 Tax=Cytobacillus depressus TaxID=1602942 RepID=A0A6L3V9K9_9BACI|nr:DUF309 domain-containing protein [Cytobacillus depressus]KAB2338376.1 DUF309 domain-containing protein [Cytobacillus depressus]
MYPQEYIDYLIHFHGDRDYFECHEVLEDYWKKVDPGNKSSIWVGLILFAVSNYHQRRGNISGAKRTLTKAIYILQMNERHLADLGLDGEKLISDLEIRLQYLTKGRVYSSYNFPIIDHSLISLCKKKCTQEEFIWCGNSDLKNQEIIHRHLLRDRSQVIQERNIALKNRKAKAPSKMNID